jgi:predicted DNA-binding transcriptional regulator YafY
LCFLEYSDNEGAVTQRFIRLSCKGIGSNRHQYLGAFDNERFKTFRADRVLKLEQL